jgi:hypothetical protein
MFTGMASLIPLGAAYAHSALIQRALVPMDTVIIHGELFLLASAMCATGIGELFGSAGNWREVKIISGGIAFLVGIFSTFLFAMTSVTTGFDGEMTFDLSAWLFLAAWVSSSSCVALSEVV